MKQYIILCDQLTGHRNIVHKKDDVVSADRLIADNVNDLVAAGFIQEYPAPKKEKPPKES